MTVADKVAAHHWLMLQIESKQSKAAFYNSASFQHVNQELQVQLSHEIADLTTQLTCLNSAIAKDVEHYIRIAKSVGI